MYLLRVRPYISNIFLTSPLPLRTDPTVVVLLCQSVPYHRIYLKWFVLYDKAHRFYLLLLFTRRDVCVSLSKHQHLLGNSLSLSFLH